jgi:hypothetical protein
LQTQLGLPFGLPAIAVAERVYSETTDSVDDIRVEFTGGGRVFGQCKKSLNLSDKPTGEWASVILQFYGELRREAPAGVERRLVLFYEEHNKNLERLRRVLDRYRDLPDGSDILDAATNEPQRDVVRRLISLLTSVGDNSDGANSGTYAEDLLRHVYIKQLRLEPGEPDYLGVVDALQEGLLTDPVQTHQAVTSLHRLADDLLPQRGTKDRLALRVHLQGEGIGLRETVGYRADFERLDEWTTTEVAAHKAEGRAELRIDSRKALIDRPVVCAMLGAVQAASFLVVGDAGAGKTGCLLSLADRLKASGRRVWYWAADSLPDPSPQEMGVHLRLVHSWAGLLAEAASGGNVILIVDGLDGLRDTRAQQAYRKLFALAIRCGVRVVASIRSFDLHYALDLQDIFPKTDMGVRAEFQKDSFSKVSHVWVDELTIAEIAQAVAQFPDVLDVLKIAPQLLPVVFNLFSLELLCRLLGDGEDPSTLTSISTQAELFERFWARRVDGNPLRDKMTAALTGLIEGMTAERSLQVVAEAWEGHVRTALFSANLVRHPATTPGRLPERRLVEFSHHLLFDYAAELLFVRPRHSRLAQELSTAGTWGLFLRPSLRLFYLRMWRSARDDFWDTAMGLERGSVSIIHKLPAHLIVGEHANSREDLRPLLERAVGREGTALVQGVVSAAVYITLPYLFRKGKGDWWLEFAHDLVSKPDPYLVQDGRWILLVAANALEALSAECRHLFNQAALALTKFHMETETDPSPAYRVALEWVCQTIDCNPGLSVELIRNVIKEDELRRTGYIWAYAIANNIDAVWKADPHLAAEVYDAVFGYVEASEAATSLDGSKILSLLGNRKQDYEMAFHLLAAKFSGFLTAHPSKGTSALIKVARHYRDREYPVDAYVPPEEVFHLNGRTCRIQADRSSIWDSHAYDDERRLLERWEEHIRHLPEGDKAEERWSGIFEVLIMENELAAVWRRLLNGASAAPAFYAHRLKGMLLNHTILVGADTQEAAEECVEAFAPHLPDEELRQIEDSILTIGKERFAGYDEENAEWRLAYTKVKFLSRIPEAKRGDAVRAFLAGCDPELLGICQHELEFAAENYPPHMWNRQAARESSTPETQELIKELKELQGLSAEGITPETATAILHNVSKVEQKLGESRDKVGDQLAYGLHAALANVLKKVVTSQPPLKESDRDELFEKFRAMLSAPEMTAPQEMRWSFEEISYWDLTSPRVRAAEGLISLSLKAGPLRTEWQEVLRQVARDEDPIIRGRLAERLWEFFKVWEEFVWETIERWVEELPTRGDTHEALQTVFNRGPWLWWLRNNDIDRADQLLRNLFAAAHSAGEAKLQSHAGEWVAGLWLVKEAPWAAETLNRATQSVEEYLSELWGAQKAATDVLFATSEDKPVPPERSHRGAKFLVRLLSSAKLALDTYWSAVTASGPTDGSIEHPEWVKSTARLFDQVGIKFRFTAEEYKKQWAEAGEAERKEKITAWWERVEPVVDAVLALPHPRIAFNLIEGIESLTDFDVRRGLYWLRRATEASAPSGLANESLAADRTIGILERVLAEPRLSLAAEDDVRSNFLTVLEAYLGVGWPRAMELAAKLDSIFR